ncbi:MAG: homoserine kinase, partial [Chloroflexota bacterium]|nr:homoserine kinase [Chloroflexota bacterium]
MSELRIRVPASSANLGPGFDSFALALPLLAEFELHPAKTWSVTVEGDGVGVPVDEGNLFVVSARAAAKAAGREIAAQHVTQRSAIPIARGLGSSAAAIVGGAVAANALLGEPFDRRTLLRITSEVEG